MTIVDNKVLVDIIYQTARKYYRAMLVNTDVPLLVDTLADMRNPQIGDFVFESTSWDESAMGRVGFLVDKNTLKTFDGAETQWGNCEFIKIPINITMEIFHDESA